MTDSSVVLGEGLPLRVRGRATALANWKFRSDAAFLAAATQPKRWRAPALHEHDFTTHPAPSTSPFPAAKIPGRGRNLGESARFNGKLCDFCKGARCTKAWNPRLGNDTLPPEPRPFQASLATS